jgi:hypothetical protein
VHNIDRKEPVATVADLATTYADAEEGWIAAVLEFDPPKDYQFDGEAWYEAYPALPMADATHNGQMSSTDYLRVLDYVFHKGAATIDHPDDSVTSKRAAVEGHVG